MEWQVNFLSLLGIVERMASFALQINGLDQDALGGLETELRMDGRIDIL